MPAPTRFTFPSDPALHMCAEQAAPLPAQEPYVADMPPRPPAPAASLGAGPLRARRGGLLQRVLQLPAAAVRLALGALNVGVSVLAFVAHRALPPPMLRRLQGPRACGRVPGS